MDVESVVQNLKGCHCGRSHEVNIKCIAIERGLVRKCADILLENGFPKKILVVSDENALKASEGILENLKDGGIEFSLKLYEDVRVASEELVREVESAAAGFDGILSVGSGSCNDICRRAALLAEKEFAIFATAPSMDGFASGTAPITDKNFKTTMPARQPSIIIGDTEILAEAPSELKVAGFGDVLAKYIALADWRISALLTGEYYCESIAELVRGTLKKMVSLADKVTSEDPEAAGSIMEALVWAGLFMKLADSVRPASGTEHIISHFWEIKKLEKGLLSDFHGRKVGVATLYAARIYYEMIASENVVFTEDKTDWDEVYGVYGDNFKDDVYRLNNPTITEKVGIDSLRKNWENICDIVRSEIPAPDEILSLLRRAQGAENLEDIEVSHELGVLGLKYHPYMRYRMTLMRLLPMTNIKIDYEKILCQSAELL